MTIPPFIKINQLNFIEVDPNTNTETIFSVEVYGFSSLNYLICYSTTLFVLGTILGVLLQRNI